MVRRRDVLVPLSVNLPELFLVGLCVLSGVARLFGFGAPSASHLPAWADTAWSWLLLVGGLLGVAGLLWPDAGIGLPVERAAMWLMAAGAGAYAVAVAGTGQWLSAVVVVGFALAFAGHAVHITRLLQRRPR